MKTIGQVPPILLYCLVALSTLTETIYSAALPVIAEQLHTDGGIAQMSTTAYYIGFAVGVFTLGRISDIYGRRPVVLFGISFYLVATVLISLSTNIEVFIICRFLQAYGASVGSVIAQAMTRDSYKGWELSYVYANVGMTLAIVPSIGSTIGGYIIEYYQQWQYIFQFLVLLSGVSLIIYARFLPETNPYLGVDHANRFFATLKVVIKDRLVLSYAFIVGVYNGVCFGFYIQAPFIFIDKMQMLPSSYGKLFFILTIANMAGSLLCQYLVKRFVSVYKIKIFGFLLSAVGCVFLIISSLLISEASSIVFVSLMIFVPMAIHLMGHAMVVPMLLRNALEGYNKVNGAAGSIFGSLYYLITAVVSFMISAFHSDTIDNYAYLFAVMLTCCLMLFYLTFNGKQELDK